MGYNTNGIRYCKELLEIASKNIFPKLKDFALKMRWAFGNTYNACVRARTFSTLKQVESTVKTKIECRPATRRGAWVGEDHLEKFSSPAERCFGHNLKL